MKLTAPQRRALEILGAVDNKVRGMSAAEVARNMWPDSPAWRIRTRRGSTPAGGALGATMPMKAGSLLGRLRDRRLAYCDRSGWWHITSEGRAALQ